MKFLPARAGSLVATAALASLLAACSPEYDWRELSVADGRATAAFPAKVQTESRPVHLDGVQLPFALTFAAVGKGLFAVGYASLPEPVRGNPGEAARLAGALTRAFYANLGLQPPEQLPAPGEEITLHAELDGEPLRLVARVMVLDGAVMEAVAMGPARSLPVERAQEFVRSLRPVRSRP